jgi:hypothetical protein
MMMCYRLSFVTILLMGIVFSPSKAQTNFYLNGLGRAVITNDKLSGAILENDSATARRGAGGYALFDLKPNLDVNKTFRANVILRVRNEFGAFWGRGANLEFRQLQMTGLIRNVIKYEIGDINISMTPYTVYNSNEIYHTYESDIHSMRRKILEYENFNFDNAWRLQGAQASTTLLSKKVIQKFGIKAFGTRTNPTNETTVPDRVFAGAGLNVVQSKYLELGFNYVGLLDIPIQTALMNYQNDVYTGDLKLNFEKETFGVSLKGETGASNYKYQQEITQQTSASYGDFFYDVKLTGAYKPLNIKVFASYKDVGAQFTSPGAQTRRLDVTRTPLLFSSVIQDTVNRGQILFDRFTQERIYNRSLSPLLQTYLPQYNNISPYGPATPNRQGLSYGISGGSNDKVVEAEVIGDLLQEVIGEGVPEKRKFVGLRGGTRFHLNKLIQFKKDITINAGIRNESTTRTGQAEIKFNSSLIDAGFTVEVVNKVDLIAGMKYLQAEGNEFIPVRDEFNTMYTVVPVIMNSVESTYSGGLRVRFAENSYFTVNYNVSDYKNKNINTLSYTMRQLFANCTIIF